MRQANRMGVEIDFCPRCRGVWLDGGELEKIIERSSDIIPAEYSPPPPQEYRPQEVYREQPRHDNRGYDDRGRHDDHRYGDGRHDDRHHGGGHHGDRHHGKHHKKKKGFLGELFDIFD